jgi:hypothetical protein
MEAELMFPPVKELGELRKKEASNHLDKVSGE